LDPDRPELEQLKVELAQNPADLRTGFGLLQRVVQQAAALALHDGAGDEWKWWTRALDRNCRDHLGDLLFLAPWLTMAPQTAGRFSAALAQLDQVPTLRQVSELEQSLCPLLESALKQPTLEPASSHKPEEGAWLASWLSCLHEASTRARQRLLVLAALVRQSGEMAEMNFRFLFDPARELFSIGFNATENRLDASFYDLLASESRLCSYVAIAEGQVPQDHWFSLGRLLVAVHGGPVLASWSGSMFEYLMPLLVMPSYENTLLSQTCKGAVRQQIAYGRLRGIPWGISESGYNRTDIHLNFQYRAFGVPGLGLKRGLDRKSVV